MFPVKLSFIPSIVKRGELIHYLSEKVDITFATHSSFSLKDATLIYEFKGKVYQLQTENISLWINMRIYEDT